jgi:hypothetical protein
MARARKISSMFVYEHPALAIFVGDRHKNYPIFFFGLRRRGEVILI